MKITRDDCLGEAEVVVDGAVGRYYLFTAPYNSQDCYHFLPFEALGGLPTDRLGVKNLADVTVYCDHWDHVLGDKPQSKSQLRKALVEVFGGIMAVEDVYAL